MINISALGRDQRGNSIWGNLSRKELAAWLFVMIFALALQGCAPTTSVVKTITRTSAASYANDSFASGDSTFMDGQLNEPMTFQVWGDGICKRMFINYGDGTQPVEYTNVDLASKPTFTHTYTGWNGQKTVWAFGNLTDGCGGNARIPIRVGKLWLIVGYKPVPTACAPYPDKPPLRKNTIVRITNANAGNTSANEAAVIDFGCVGGCWNYAGGVDAIAQENSGYPFPGFHERSLVIKVGTQKIQGGIQYITTFTTTEAGPLEFCLNDYKLDDNTGGGWGIAIRIDESAAE
jgi:hypothetical protein